MFAQMYHETSPASRRRASRVWGRIHPGAACPSLARLRRRERITFGGLFAYISASTLSFHRTLGMTPDVFIQT